MAIDPSNPLIVQSDRTLLLDVHAPRAEEGREAIMPFAELEKSPEHIHTYRISPLSLWNAASAGFRPEDIGAALEEFTRYPIPRGILEGFTDTMSRYGKIRMRSDNGDTLFLECEDEAILAEIAASQSLEKYLQKRGKGFRVKLTDRGTVKRELIRLGWPVKDEASFVQGDKLEFSFRNTAMSGLPFTIRDYQEEAARAVQGNGGPGTGYGVVVLPCGSGKTIVGMLLMSMLKTNTLILTTNVAATHQWIDELLDKTDLKAEDLAEYSGDRKAIAPVTIATYQIITWRPRRVDTSTEDGQAEFPHFKLFRERAWGLIIYDEVHLLPAPIFRVTAELQAVRRLGLTATLIREDGNEDAVFSLVGPKRYDVPWKDIEAKGWIAEALCTEIRLDLPEDLKIPYAVATPREKYRIASENPLKEKIAFQLIENHGEDQILVIGQYISQLESLARLLKVPLITGKTPNPERERIYGAFRRGELRVIVVSKVANFAIDLPDASMAIQISGSFGSRQEEAQRLGRILRPKARNSWFFTLVSRYTVEEDFAANRQKFLAEQGYKYSIRHWGFE
ncbi:MAG: DEAD/DEAH box helicase [Treponema sp.]|jgi:DNA excision repair protein ERCC-3|nr:DEAD/DEAH box helicase [Treponema sp.]